MANVPLNSQSSISSHWTLFSCFPRHRFFPASWRPDVRPLCCLSCCFFHSLFRFLSLTRSNSHTVDPTRSFWFQLFLTVWTRSFLFSLQPADQTVALVWLRDRSSLRYREEVCHLDRCFNTHTHTHCWLGNQIAQCFVLIRTSGVPPGPRSGPLMSRILTALLIHVTWSFSFKWN